MLRLKNGDLIALAKRGEFDVIVHGCNCFNTMGAGIAYAIASKFPEAREADLKTVRGDKSKLGTFTEAQNGNLTIINAYTQYDFGSNEEDVFNYDAFDRILIKLMSKYPKANFGFPLIGCGLAGGDKVRVIRKLQEFAGDINVLGGTVTLVTYAP